VTETAAEAAGARWNARSAAKESAAGNAAAARGIPALKAKTACLIAAKEYRRFSLSKRAEKARQKKIV